MKRTGRHGLAAITLLLLAGVSALAHAQDKAPARPQAPPVDERVARVDEALRLSDIKVRLAAIRARLLAYIEADATTYTTKHWVTGSLKTAYSLEAYTRPVRQALLDSYDADALTRVILWYRSPAGRKITGLEAAAQEPGQLAARRKYLATLENRPVSDYRLVLVFSIDEASYTSASTSRALSATFNGWNLGLAQLAGEPERAEIRAIEAALRKYRAEFRDIVADDTLQELLYTYRDASETDLRAYAEFLESDAGKWFFRTAYKAHQAFFETVADQIGEDLVRTVTQPQTYRSSGSGVKPSGGQAGSEPPPPALPDRPRPTAPPAKK